jgi:hypothetical protein
MPNLGIIASSLSGKLETNSFISIATTTVGTATSTITFSSIPSTYQHLQLRAFSNSTTGAPARIRFNSDSGSNYALQVIQGNSASVGVGGVTAQSGIDGIISANASNVFGASIVDILDYTNTSKYTTIKAFDGYETGSSGTIYQYSGLWLNTSAISTITLTDSSGGNFNTYSSFALYGIKG